MKKGIRSVPNPIAWAYRSVRVQWIRWRVKHDFVTHRPDDHPGLKKFTPNETINCKGVMFRVRARYTDPAPCLILEPVGSSKNAMLNRLRDLRREDRIERKQLEQIRKRLNRRWQEVRHVD